jgi:hypothetical protein
MDDETYRWRPRPPKRNVRYRIALLLLLVGLGLEIGGVLSLVRLRRPAGAGLRRDPRLQDRLARDRGMSRPGRVGSLAR